MVKIKKMSNQFRARRTGTKKVQFQCPLKCGQCRYRIEKENRRCKRRVCIGFPYCYQHLPKKMGIQIKKSEALASIGINSKGLYATRDFKKGEEIAPYNAPKISSNRASGRYDYCKRGKLLNNTVPYGMGDGDQIYDAACRRVPASLANSPYKTGKHSNAELVISKENNKPYLMAKKNIKAGSEILTRYGKDYWKYNKNLEVTPSVYLKNKGKYSAGRGPGRC